jgi:hypothetical protein
MIQRVITCEGNGLGLELGRLKLRVRTLNGEVALFESFFELFWIHLLDLYDGHEGNGQNDDEHDDNGQNDKETIVSKCILGTFQLDCARVRVRV